MIHHTHTLYIIYVFTNYYSTKCLVCLQFTTIIIYTFFIITVKNFKNISTFIFIELFTYHINITIRRKTITQTILIISLHHNL